MTTLREQRVNTQRIFNSITGNPDALVQAAQACLDIPEYIQRINDIPTFAESQAAELRDLNKKLFTTFRGATAEAQDSTIDLSPEGCTPEAKALYEQVRDIFIHAVLLRRGPEASSDDLKRLIVEVSSFIDGFNDASLKELQSSHARIERSATRL